MRKFLPLPLLALLAAPWPAAAQSDAQLFCFANDTALTLFRVKIIQVSADGREAANDWTRVPGKSRHCERFERPYAVRFEVQFNDITWQASHACSRKISQPSTGALLHTNGTSVSGFYCSLE